MSRKTTKKILSLPKGLRYRGVVHLVAYLYEEEVREGSEASGFGHVHPGVGGRTEGVDCFGSDKLRQASGERNARAHSVFIAEK